MSTGTTDLAIAEKMVTTCEECRERCEPIHRGEYGLWRNNQGYWFALHKWCIEAWMEVNKPGRPRSPK